MKRFALAMFVVVAALVLTNSALANSVSLTFQFDHNDHYNFSVSRASSLSTMMGDKYNSHVFGGENWTAPKSPFLRGSSLLFSPTGNAPDKEYFELVLYTPHIARVGCGPEELSPVPEPANMMLLGTGLVAMAGAVRRKFVKA